MKKTGLWAMLALAIFGLSACGSKVEINDEQIELEDGVYAKMATSEGDILLKLNTELAPMTAANFVLLAEGNMPEVSEDLKGKRFYDGLTFHRVIPQFMIQGGDPLGTGAGNPGYKFPNEVTPELSHTKGVISMANSGPNTNGSQFFITVADRTELDGGYSVFGEVVEGQWVADSISIVKTDQANKPNETVTINTVEIIRVGADNESWDALAAFEAGKAGFDEEQRVAREEAAKRAQEQLALLQAKYPNAEQSASGLLYVIETLGDGEKPADGSYVDINYAGYLTDGTLFDTSIKELAQENNIYNPQREPYSPMPMEYGPRAQVIPGFAEGISMFNVGGKGTIIIPPNLGYGERGGGPIPPNSWLIFDVEIVGLSAQQPPVQAIQ
jgi:peptidyl-prolyl cis-trans isomerase A (cyclophilin A)